jgi:hypothetical protein
MAKVTKVSSEDKIVESRTRYMQMQSMFEHLDVEKIRPYVTMAEIRKTYKTREKKELAVRMAQIMLVQIVNDVVYEAYTYQFSRKKNKQPMYSFETMRFQCKQGPHYGEYFTRFKFLEVGQRPKDIRLSKVMEDLMWDDKIEPSKPNKTKTYMDYVTMVNDRFPEFKREDIRTILRTFDQQLAICLSKGIKFKVCNIAGFFFYNEKNLILDSLCRHELFDLQLDDRWVIDIQNDRIKRDDYIYRQNLRSKSPYAKKYDTTTGYFLMSRRRFEEEFIPQKDEDIYMFERVYVYRKYNYGLRSCVWFRIKNMDNLNPRKVRKYFDYLEVKKEDLEILQYEKSRSKYLYRWFDDGCESSDNGAELSD